MIGKTFYGKTKSGRDVFLYSLINKTGMKINIITYGAIVTNIFTADKNGSIDDVVLGYDSPEGYLNDTYFIGAVIGRYGNRIAKGKFSLNNKLYQLTINNGENHLHGGIKGFNKIVWNAETAEDESGSSVILKYKSPDGEEGYPGNLDVKVIYSLNDKNEFVINYSAVTDKPTIVNLTHHSYFNLSGDFNKDVLDHELHINADNFLTVNEKQIPVGIEETEGTPMDFRIPKKIGLNINDNFAQIKIGNGYDHNWIINNFDNTLRYAASLYYPENRRYMEVFTDQPGMQFYSGNFLEGRVEGKKKTKLKFRCGLCLETQLYPDSPNNQSFPSAVLNSGEIYRHRTIYKFSVK